MSITNWVQANKDGFGYPRAHSATDKGRLFVFGGDLYAYGEHGLFKMNNLICRDWEKLFTPAKIFKTMGDYLYCVGPKELWWIKKGERFSSENWKQVTLTGINPEPVTVFKGEIYGVYHYNDSSNNLSLFDIYRSKDIGKTTMKWQLVVTQSFGDSQNNMSVDFIGAFNGKIYVGTNTLRALYGSPQGKDKGGVEIWESASGDPGSWSQVNVDGFGTSISYPANSSKKLFTNHVIGSWAVYKAPNQSQKYLYVGTKSHWGAEVWRYNGKGKIGWKNVTPPWAGPLIGGSFANNLGRNESMAIFQDSLYLAEGYPAAKLAKYDGTNWSIVVKGPYPFDPQNAALTSLAVFENHLYAHTGFLPYSAATKGDQVWAYPFNFVVWKFACLIKSLLFWPILTWRWVKELVTKGL